MYRNFWPVLLFLDDEESSLVPVFVVVLLSSCCCCCCLQFQLFQLDSLAKRGLSLVVMCKSCASHVQVMFKSCSSHVQVMCKSCTSHGNFLIVLETEKFSVLLTKVDSTKNW